MNSEADGRQTSSVVVVAVPRQKRVEAGCKVTAWSNSIPFLPFSFINF